MLLCSLCTFPNMLIDCHCTDKCGNEAEQQGDPDAAQTESCAGQQDEEWNTDDDMVQHGDDHALYRLTVAVDPSHEALSHGI